MRDIHIISGLATGDAQRFSDQLFKLVAKTNAGVCGETGKVVPAGYVQQLATEILVVMDQFNYGVLGKGLIRRKMEDSVSKDRILNQMEPVL